MRELDFYKNSIGGLGFGILNCLFSIIIVICHNKLSVRYIFHCIQSL